MPGTQQTSKWDGDISGMFASDRPDDRFKPSYERVGLLSLSESQPSMFVGQPVWAAASRGGAIAGHWARLAAFLTLLGAAVVLLGWGALHVQSESHPRTVPLIGRTSTVDGTGPSGAAGTNDGTNDGTDDGTNQGTTVPPPPTTVDDGNHVSSTTTPPPITPTTVPTVVEPPIVPPPPQAVAGPLLQVSVAAKAGADAALVVGLGDPGCTGLRLLSVVIGCPPATRDTTGATVDISGALLPPLHVSVP